MNVNLKILPNELKENFATYLSGTNIATFYNNDGNGNLIIRDFKGRRIFQLFWFDKNNKYYAEECDYIIMDMQKNELITHIIESIKELRERNN